MSHSPTPPAGEDRVVAWLRRYLAGRGTCLIGDDAAALPPAGDLVVTVDQQIEGTHLPEGLAARLVGRRLVAVNLSDLAAMGASPAFGLLAVALPAGYDARALLRSVAEALSKAGATLAGGDLARAERLTAALTLIGRRAPRGRLLARSGARPDDRLWIGGSLGEAAAGCALVQRGARLAGRAVELPPGLPPGLGRAAARAVRRHLLPEPQLELGQWLARRRRAAAIDVSDGLALDLHRLCRESAVGARIDAGALPRARDFDALCVALDLDAEALALGGGEDYVLLFALPPSIRVPAAFGCHPIGRVLAAHRVTIDRGRGGEPLAAVGWDHLGS